MIGRLNQMGVCGRSKQIDLPVITLETNTKYATFFFEYIGLVSVDWGDGTSENIKSQNVAHVYDDARIRVLSIYAESENIIRFGAGYGNNILKIDTSKALNLTQLIIGNNAITVLDVSQNTNLNRVEINGCGLVNNDTNLMLLARDLTDRTGKGLGTLRLMNAAQAEKIKDILTPKNWFAG